ncbi:MAG TPA: glycosyltransferase [Bryobacteraceae bacterium]|nr:glycosyltransferase [Bryobacteraceae bacterium]
MASKISVVIPAYNGGMQLDACLDAIAHLSTPAAEVIVVDDGSDDGSIQRAAARGIRILPTSGRTGPAVARNVGAQAATGDILFFLDADVCAHEDAVERVAAAFADPSIDAVIGSYDDNPSSRDFLSQYKNLMHCFVHQNAHSEASTFWSGCGAIRRDVFLAMSGFDASYKRPAIEDIELGYRLRKAGRRILLDRDLRVKHLKKWTFWGLLKTDVLDRGIPWTELILRDQKMPNDLNLQISQRVSIGLVYLMLLYAAIHAIRFGGYALLPLFTILFILLSSFWSDGAEHRSWGVCAAMIAGAATIVLAAWRIHMRGLIPLVVAIVPLLFLRHRYDQRGRWAALNAWFHGLYICAVVAVSIFYLKDRYFIAGVITGVLVLATLNNGFYLFLSEKRGRLFALAAFPFHLLYHFYNGVSFLMGSLLWSVRAIQSRTGEERRRASDDARGASAS